MCRLPQPPVETLAERLLNGEIIPFLGAGASSYSHDQPGGALPDGKAFATELAERANIDIVCNEQCLTGGCNMRCSRHLFDLARVSSYYQFCVSTRGELDRFIRTKVSNPSLAPSPLHRLLARIASKKNLLFITTNYDNLLELAFDELNREAGETLIQYDVVATPADQLSYEDTPESEAPEYAGGLYVRRGDSPHFEVKEPKDIVVDLKQRSLIYKIHGSLGDASWTGGFLIAEEDYCRFLGRMQIEGLIPANIFNEIRKKVKISCGPNRTKAMPAHSLLFLGYGMNDWNLRVLLRELKIGTHAPGEEIHYAIVRNASDIDSSLMSKRGITPYECELKQFVDQLGSSVERLSDQQSCSQFAYH